MDIYYLKEHLCEELDGAKDYLKKAINLKMDKPDWARSFYDMSNAEFEHAKNIYRILNEYYREIDVKPELKDYMEPFKNSIDEHYMECVGMIKYMQESYK